MADKDDLSEKAVLEAAKKLGYRIRKPGEYVKFSTLVHENTLLKFKQVAEELDYQVQEACTEAFDIWLEAKIPELKHLAKERDRK